MESKIMIQSSRFSVNQKQAEKDKQIKPSIEHQKFGQGQQLDGVQKIRQFQQRCQICLRATSAKSRTRLDCTHQFCTTCLLQWADQAIKQFKPITCPISQCGHLIRGEQAIYLDQLPTQTKKIYRKYVNYSNLSNQKGRVICPNEHCQDGTIDTNAVSSIQINVQTNAQNFQNISKLKPNLLFLQNFNVNMKVVSCENCSKIFCSRCLKMVIELHHDGKVDYHAIDGCALGLCSMWYQQRQQIRNMHSYKKCMECNQIVQKSKGCNHMTCKCGNQFCYKCGQDWKFPHLCNPFLYRSPTILQNKQQTSQNIQQKKDHQAVVAKVAQVDEQPQLCDYKFYVMWMVGLVLWTIFVFIFCLFPLLFAFLLFFCLYIIGLVLLGITYGYFLSLSHTLCNKDEAVCIKIVFTLLPIVPQCFGVIKIFKLYFNKIFLILRHTLKYCDLVLPFRIIRKNWIN